jgi:hypothetical protein
MPYSQNTSQILQRLRDSSFTILVWLFVLVISTHSMCGFINHEITACKKIVWLSSIVCVCRHWERMGSIASLINGGFMPLQPEYVGNQTKLENCMWYIWSTVLAHSRLMLTFNIWFKKWNRLFCINWHSDMEMNQNQSLIWTHWQHLNHYHPFPCSVGFRWPYWWKGGFWASWSHWITRRNGTQWCPSDCIWVYSMQCLTWHWVAAKYCSQY